MSIVMCLLEIETSRALSNTRRSESGTRPVGRASVEGRANESNVELDIVIAQALLVWQTTKGRDSRED